jgi:hypothetical protein
MFWTTRYIRFPFVHPQYPPEVAAMRKEIFSDQLNRFVDQKVQWHSEIKSKFNQTN